MGYLGLTPTTAQQNYLNIDDISGSFNGSTTSFALQVGSVAPTPFPVTNSCLISVGGVIQEPDDTGTSGFRISGGNIVFSSAPGTGEDFFGLILAGADYLNIGANFPDGTVGTPSITFDSDTNTGIYHPSADELSFVTGGSDRVRVDSNGRLGIGTTSPSGKLDVESGSDTYLNITTTSGTSGAGISLLSNANEGFFGYQNALRFGTITGKNAGGWNERARIDSSGNLGLGVTPTATNGQGRTIQIGSNILLQNVISSQASFSLNAIYDGNWKYITAASAAAVRLVSGHIQFHASNAVGTAGGTISNWDSQSGTGEMMRIANGGDIHLYSTKGQTTASAANVFIDSSSGVLRRSTSSIKYKTDVETLQDSYANAVLDCRPVWYRSTAAADNPAWGWWGFIAEEVAEIDPRLVHWKTHETTTGIDGDTITEELAEPVPEGVQYDRFVPHLLNLIKRQKEQIETQGSAIAALEARLSALESA